MDKDSLVDQIKQLQRADFGAKQAWWDYCDKNFGGIKDPNKHEVTALNTFLVGFRTGAIQPVNTPMPGSSKGFGKGAGPPLTAQPADFMAAMAKWMASSGGGGGGGPAAAAFPGGEPTLQDFVKLGQRHSILWKQSWQWYCTLNGNQMFDPAKYDKTYITGFIDYLGQLASEDLTVAAAAQGVTLEKAPLLVGKRGLAFGADAAPPPAKRFNVGTGAAFAPTPGNDPHKAPLVDRVKSLQRSNPAAKEAWAQYCLEQLGGVKDPSRHDAIALQGFLDSFGA